MSRSKERREKGRKGKKKANRPPETGAQESPAQDQGEEPGASTSPEEGLVAPAGWYPKAEAPSAEAASAEAAEDSEGSQPTAREQELLDSLTRLMADFDNFRKRMRRDQAQADHDIRSRLILKLLPTLDDYDRARGAAGPRENRADRDVLLRILGGLADVLTGEGLTPIQVEPGDSFDPSIHEAIGTSYSQGIPAQHVLEVFERGYFFRERLLRPARVLVSLGEQGKTPESEGEPGESSTAGEQENHESDGPDPDR